MDSKLTSVISRIRQQLEAAGPEGMAPSELENGSTAGTLGALNTTGTLDAFDNFIAGILRAILNEFDVEEDDAFGLIFDTADELESTGDLPPMPDDSSSDQDYSIWLGSAQTFGFGGYVIKAARDMADDEE